MPSPPLALFVVMLPKDLLTSHFWDEDTKKRWQDYIEELYKKDLHDPDNHDGVVTHLEPDILECKSSGP